MTCERDCFTLVIVWLFEEIVATYACPDSDVVKEERQFSDFNVSWQWAERTWLILLTKRKKYCC